MTEPIRPLPSPETPTSGRTSTLPGQSYGSRMRRHAILDVCWNSLVTTTSGREPFALDDAGFAQLENAITAYRGAADVDHVTATLTHVAAFLDENGAASASEDILALAARLATSRESGRLRLLPPLEDDLDGSTHTQRPARVPFATLRKRAN